MKVNNRLIIGAITLILSALACNLPGRNVPVTVNPTTESSSSNQAVQSATSMAELSTATSLAPTENAVVTVQALPTITQISTSTNTPTSTASPVPTLTPIPCNRAQFINDVTIPDGSNITANSSFTKTWRLKNTGSCTWTSGYLLVFDSGDQMNGPASQQLTASTVTPGQEVNISINLTAPVSPGSYRGYWKIQDQNGAKFGVSTGAFYVDIKSIAAVVTLPPIIVIPLPPPVGSISAPLVAAESGAVRSDGNVTSVTNLGDNGANLSQQVFLSFDISAIPAGATILEVKTNFSNNDTLGNPFSLGCLRMYPHNYGSVDASDYVSGSAMGAILRFCDLTELNTTSVDPDLKTQVQSSLGTGRVKLRAQFNETTTNNNGVADVVRLGPGLQIIISFTVP